MSEMPWEPMPGLAGWYELRKEDGKLTEIVLVKDLDTCDGLKSIVFYPMRRSMGLPFCDLDSLDSQNLVWRGPHRQFETPLRG